MPNHSDSLGSRKATGCAVCDGKFGLVRHYSWGTPLCSRKCVDRFRVRHERDLNWVGWLKVPSSSTQRTARAL